MENLKLDDFKNYKFISGLKLSPSGKNVAVVSRKATKDNDYNAVIYVDKGNGFIPLTNANGKASQFLWLDDETLLFSEVRDKADKEKIEKGHELTCFYSISINGGEAELAFRANAKITNAELLEGGKFLVSAAFDNSRPCLEGKSDAEAAELLREYKKQKAYQVIDELPFWFNARGFTSKKRNRLYLMSALGELTPITDPLTNVSGYKLSSCKKYAAYAGNIAPADMISLESNIHIVNLATLEENTALPEPKRIRAFDFWCEKIVVSYSEVGQRLHEHGPFYIADPANKKVTKLADFDLSIGSSGGTDSTMGGGTTDMVVSDKYYFTALCGYHADIFALDLNSGEIANTTNSKTNIHFFDMKGGRTTAGIMQSGRLLEIFEVDGESINKISSFNDEIHDTRKYSPPQHFVFEDSDGVEIDGWVIEPTDYKVGNKYPAILNIHGGPKAAYCESYFHEMQYLANHGYFVIFSNPRGGDGKGNEFADIRGQYGGVDYENLMQFVDECLKRYSGIDAERMGVMGGSYGGFMTNWVIGHTYRFKAAVTMRCISNWISFENVSDIGPYFGTDQMGDVSIWTDIDKLWHHSPLKYAPNVKTPCLVLHSDEDYRCWTPEALQWYTALKLHGVDTRMVLFHGENHELSRSGKPDNRVKRLEEITNWMDKYLK
ncbi:MAG: S9 family peptidase [Defluviitaleaceae bacterium]|nr:S9 family peptidase [Defluviitaleaceae bacterium]